MDEKNDVDTFAPKEFVENVWKSVNCGHGIPELAEAHFFEQLPHDMDDANLSPHQRKAVFDYLKVDPNDVPEIIRDGYSWAREIKKELGMV